MKIPAGKHLAKSLRALIDTFMFFRMMLIVIGDLKIVQKYDTNSLSNLDEL